MFYIKQWNSYYNVGDDSPMVGIVVTISPSLSLYKMVVFPAASSPTIRILISFFPNNLLKRLAKFPILSHLQEEINCQFARSLIMWYQTKSTFTKTAEVLTSEVGMCKTSQLTVAAVSRARRSSHLIQLLNISTDAKCW